MLLVDDDQAEAGDRREDRRARPDADPRLAVAQPVPLVAALAGSEARVQDRDRVAEARDEARDRLRRHPDLGHSDDHPAAALQRRLGGGEVDLGLARAGDPVQEQLRPARVEPGDDPLEGPPLRRVELDRPAAGADRGAARAPAHLALAELDQAAALEPAQRVAGDPRCGELAAAELGLGADEQLERAPLHRSERLALECDRGRARRAGGDLGPRRGLAAARAGPRRQHQVEATRRGRAVLPRHPERELDQLRRDAGLERRDRLGQALRRQLAALGDLDHDPEQALAPERDLEQGPDADLAEALGQQVVERPP